MKFKLMEQYNLSMTSKLAWLVNWYTENGFMTSKIPSCYHAESSELVTVFRVGGVKMMCLWRQVALKLVKLFSKAREINRFKVISWTNLVRDYTQGEHFLLPHRSSEMRVSQILHLQLQRKSGPSATRIQGETWWSIVLFFKPHVVGPETDR